MKSLAASILAAALATAVAAQKPDEPSPEPPPPQPISLRIVGKGKVTIDRGGRTAAAYRDGVKNGTIDPAPVTCDLSLKITNNTKETLKVRLTGAVPAVTLSLKGKGEVAARTARVGKAGGRITYADLAPGASTTIPLNTLSGFKSTTQTHHFPLDAGEYELSASFSTYIYTSAPPPPVGAKAKGKIAVGKLGAAWKGRNPNTLTTTETFRLQVEAK